MSASKKKANQQKIEEQAKIKEKLAIHGLTCAQIARDYKLPSASIRAALRYPNLNAERAIAAALGTRPEYLWRTRYHPSGQRRSQLDYAPVPTMQQRQKDQAA